MISHGLRVPPVADVVSEVVRRWGQPLFYTSDRFNEPTLRDKVPGIELDCRVTMWSEATADIRAVRKACLDGPFNIASDSRDLLIASLAKAKVENDRSGNSRMVKSSTDNSGRDDVAAALVLLASAVDRHEPWNIVDTGYVGFTRI